MSQFHSFRWLVAVLFIALGLSAAAAQPIQFGDDASQWSNDGECDDPRFQGPGSADILQEADSGHDATDCEMLFNRGEVEFVGGSDTPPTTEDGPVDNGSNMGGQVDFGDNTSMFANDGECDDPRFVGEFMAIELMEQDRGHDASDCRELFEDGMIQLKPAPSEVVSAIDFGDDTSQWNNDGECDDPRFDGPGSAVNLVDENLGHDATDCRALFLSGDVEYLGDDPAMERVSYDGVDFGDNTSVWSSDGECDDPRFAGDGMAETTSGANLGHDAQDCLGLYQEGDIRLIGSATLEQNDPNTSGIDFGDDDGEWPRDGECDDPRFEGPGMALAEYLDDATIGHDATDCRMHFISGQVTLVGGAPDNGNIVNGIDFGDDNGGWPRDGECDDSRFQGAGMAVADSLEDSNIGHDATDCLDLYRSGDIVFAGQSGPVTGEIDFGDDNGGWPRDGECDDLRFDGPGMAVIESLDEANIGHDATDCRDLYEDGQVDYVGDRPGLDIDMGDIDFGDDSGAWPEDGECDDIRFTGRGMASEEFLSGDNVARDASDCRDLFQRGLIELAPSDDEEYNGLYDGIDFGDDEGGWPRDGECDDPRFEGPGMAVADSLSSMNEGHDATDCMDLYQSGDVQLRQADQPAPPADISAGDFDFGDDNGDWPNDGECDDLRFTGEGMAAEATLTENNVGHDATDCRQAFLAGFVRIIGAQASGDNDQGTGPDIDFGDDDGAWPHDGECDDPRFEGRGMAFADTLDEANNGHDASDCRDLFESGDVTLM